MVMWGCGCSMGYFSTQSVGGGWGCGCSMGYFSTQSGWWSFIRVPMVVEWLVVGGAVVVVWVISVPRVVGGHSSGFPWLLSGWWWVGLWL